MDHGKSFSLFIMLKRVGFRNGTHTCCSLLCCSLAGKEWGMGSGGRAGGGYYVPFVSGLGLLFSRVSCKAVA